MSDWTDVLKEFGEEANQGAPSAPQAFADEAPALDEADSELKDLSEQDDAAVPPAGLPKEPRPRITVTPKPQPKSQFDDITKMFAQPMTEPSVFGALGRGAERLKQGTNIITYMLGGQDEETTIQNILASRAAELQYPETEAEKAGKKEFEDIPEGWTWENFGKAVSVFATNPKFAIGQALESAPSMLGSLGGAVAGGVSGGLVAGPAGAGAGATVGLGLGSGTVEYGNSFLQYIEAKMGGLDEAKLRAALSQPDLVNEAHWYAAKRGSMVGVFDMVGAKLGGAVAVRYMAPGTSTVSKVGGAAGALGIEGAAGAGGEAAAQALSTGQVSMKEVVAEGMLEMLMGGAEATVSPLATKAAEVIRAQRKPAEAEDIEKVVEAFGGPTPTEAPTQIPITETPTETEPTETDVPVTQEPRGEAAPPPAGDVEAPSFEQQPLPPDQWEDWTSIASREMESVVTNVQVQSEAGAILRQDVDNLEQQVGRLSSGDRRTAVEEAAMRREEIALEPTRLPQVDAVERVRESRGRTPAIAPGIYDRPREIRWSAPQGNLEARMWLDIRQDQFGNDVPVVWNVAIPDEARVEGLPPSLSSAPTERVAKAALRWAAENGYKRIAFATPDLKNEANPQLANVTFAVPEVAKAVESSFAKWSGLAGGGRGSIRVDAGGSQPIEVASFDVPKYVDASPRITGVTSLPDGNIIKGATLGDLGVSIFDFDVAKRLGDGEYFVTADAQGHSFLPGTVKLINALMKIKRKFMGDRNRLSFIIYNNPRSSSGGFHSWQDTLSGDTTGTVNGVIGVNVGSKMSTNLAVIWHILVHEFGHHLSFTEFVRQTPEMQLAIRSAWQSWKEARDAERKANTTPYRDFATQYFGPIRAKYAEALDQLAADPVRNATSDLWWDYATSFDEWFAEQTTRAITQRVEALTIVEQFFKKLGHLMARMITEAKKIFNSEFQVDPSFDLFIEQYMRDPPNISVEAFGGLDLRTKRMVQADLRAAKQDPTLGGAWTPATGPIRMALRRLFGMHIPPGIRADLAHADRINKFYEWTLGLYHLANLNKHIRELQYYKEDVALGQVRRQERMNRAMETLKKLRKLRGQEPRVWAMLEDMANLVYLTPEEYAKKIRRKPTQQELAALVRKHNLDADGVSMVAQITADFDAMLDWYKETLIRKANMIQDPVDRAIQIKAIELQIANYRKTPYLPFMRFGDFVVVVRNAAGHVVHREHFESERRQRRAFEEIKRGFPGHDVKMHVLPKESRPFYGMPPQLLELIGKQLSLSAAQKAALQQLMYDMSPAVSFRHRLQNKARTPGYSQDFRRAYANYFFHGATHMMRLELTDVLQGHIKAIREQVKFMPDGNKRGKIANYMADHFEELMNPKPDFHRLRGLGALWFLGFSAASAMLNLSQSVIVTPSYLSAKFNYAKATAAMLRAGTDLSSFYRRGSYKNQTEFELRATDELIKDGVISEAMAPALAAISEGDNLERGFGGNVFDRGLVWTLEKGMYLFEMAEQVNRRIVARATLKLAMENPNVPWLRDVERTNPKFIHRLRLSGFSQTEAIAIAAAKKATEDTQFIYRRDAQPRFMRGKMRTVFMFKTFVHNMLVLGLQDKKVGVRILLMMMLLGGLFGVPGANDIEDLLKFLGWWIFGKQFNLEIELRRWLTQYASSDTVDLVLHGLARRGFGIPAALDALGGTVGVDVPFPTLDRSRAVGLGPISPVQVGALTVPGGRDWADKTIQQSQQASGAVFGMTFNLIRAIQESQTSGYTAKNWEKAVPRSVASLMKAYQAMSEGGVKTKDGATLVKFDVRDPEQMMEVIAMGLGYNPLRVSRAWDRVIAQKEVTGFIDVKRQGLLRQYYEAAKGKDPAELDRVRERIVTFNKELPDFAKGKAITGETIKRSVTQRARTQALREQGLPNTRANIGIYQEINRLFGGDVVDVKKR